MHARVRTLESQSTEVLGFEAGAVRECVFTRRTRPGKPITDFGIFDVREHHNWANSFGTRIVSRLPGIDRIECPLAYRASLVQDLDENELVRRPP